MSSGNTPTLTLKEKKIISSSGRKIIFTAGRPPWYNHVGEVCSPFLIGITGGSASGKTTVATSIIQELGVPWVVLMSMDSFYRELTPNEKILAEENNYDFDHPNAFDFDLCYDVLRKLKSGKGVELPIYDFKTHSRSKETQKLYGANVIIFEGILSFYSKKIRDLMDMLIFVDTDSDIRLARRLKRDITERGRDIHGVIKQYNRFVKPAFDEFIFPAIKYAHMVVPRGAENVVAIDLIVKQVQRQMRSRGFNFREQLLNAHQNKTSPNSLFLLPETKQIKGLHTIIRNKETPRDDFVFYSNRLMRLAAEFCLSLLPYRTKVVVTNRGREFSGLKLTEKLCGVSIIRAGVTMESSLRAICKDIPIGKVLIQTDPVTEEPALHYLCLPKNIKDKNVILLDPTIATGAAALMAIRILLDHDVKEENIIFLSIIAAPAGIHSVAYAFSKVKIVTTAVDEYVNEKFHIIPGLGNFGDRFLGTE
ncbi:uridine-cytidine kinase-like 1 [Zophobas morio]|uniref:uridine-cytidine kinase-like 1 n=1 Tax=Zophobas morio TaxID=2755281 RepID=UPI00308281DF